MAFLAVNKDGSEFIFVYKPERSDDKWKPKLFRVFPTPVMEETASIELPKGSIFRLIGKDLTWENDAVEFTQVDINALKETIGAKIRNYLTPLRNFICLLDIKKENNTDEDVANFLVEHLDELKLVYDNLLNLSKISEIE